MLASHQRRHGPARLGGPDRLRPLPLRHRRQHPGGETRVTLGFNLLGLDPFYQQVTLGVILLLAVGVDAWTRRFE